MQANKIKKAYKEISLKSSKNKEKGRQKRPFSGAAICKKFERLIFCNIFLHFILYTKKHKRTYKNFKEFK